MNQNDNFFNSSVTTYDITITPDIFSDSSLYIDLLANKYIYLKSINDILSLLKINKLITIKDSSFNQLITKQLRYFNNCNIKTKLLYATSIKDIEEIMEILLQFSYLDIFKHEFIEYINKIDIKYLTNNSQYKDCLIKLANNENIRTESVFKLSTLLLLKNDIILKNNDYDKIILTNNAYLIGIPNKALNEVVICKPNIFNFINESITFIKENEYDEIIMLNKTTLEISKKYLNSLLEMLIKIDNVNDIEHKEQFYKSYIEYKISTNNDIRKEKTFENHDIWNQYFNFCQLKNFNIIIGNEGLPKIVENISFLVKKNNKYTIIMHSLSNITQFLYNYKPSYERIYLQNNEINFMPSALTSHINKNNHANNKIYYINSPYNTFEKYAEKQKFDGF